MSRAVRTPPAALKLTLALLAAAALAGCTTTSPDAAIAPVREQLRAATGADIARWPDAQAPSAEARARLDALLAAPLSQDGAVELALLNHRGLQADLAGLGIAQAELAQVSRLLQHQGTRPLMLASETEQQGGEHQTEQRTGSQHDAQNRRAVGFDEGLGGADQQAVTAIAQ